MITVSYYVVLLAALCYAGKQTLRCPRYGLLSLMILLSVGFEAIPFGIFLQSRLPFPSILKFSVFLVALLYGAHFHSKYSQKKPFRNGYVNAVIALGALVAAYTFLFSMDNQYGWYKTIHFTIRAVLPVICLYLLAPFGKQEAKIILITSVFCAVSAALVTPAFSDVTLKRGGGYSLETGMISAIGVPRVVGIGVVILGALMVWPSGWHQVLSRTMSPLLKILLGILAVILFASMAFSGTRGPMLSALLCLAFGGLFSANPKLIPKLTLSVITFLILIAVVLSVIPESYWTLPGVERVTGWLQSPFETQDAVYGRIELFNRAIHQLVMTGGIGVGTGNFAYGPGNNVGYGQYPHNIFLEIGAEQGLLGLLLVLACVVFAFRDTRAVLRSRNLGLAERVLSICWIYFLLNGMLSADLAGNDLFFVSAVLPSTLKNTELTSRSKVQPRNVTTKLSQLGRPFTRKR